MRRKKIKICVRERTGGCRGNCFPVLVMKLFLSYIPLSLKNSLLHLTQNYLENIYKLWLRCFGEKVKFNNKKDFTGGARNQFTREEGERRDSK